MDPLLTSLREAGAIMPPRMCTGPNISLPALYDPRAPLWVASDAQAWVTSLRTAVEINAVNGSLQVRGKGLEHRATVTKPQIGCSADCHHSYMYLAVPK